MEACALASIQGAATTWAKNCLDPVAVKAAAKRMSANPGRVVEKEPVLQAAVELLTLEALTVGQVRELGQQAPVVELLDDDDDVAPGEAHEQLALVERRRAFFEKGIGDLHEWLWDYGTSGGNAIREAISYVVPELNATPSPSGFSPSQWVLGQQPSFPGELLGSSLAPMHLETSFENELNKRNAAKIAIIHADTDQRLRRALLRKYAGPLQPGMKCFYWRGARAADLVKIRWKALILREDDADQRPNVYWIAHKSQLLTCAPHHVRPEIGKAAAATTFGDLHPA